MDKQELYAKVAGILQETFDIDPAAIQPGARLGEDLDIDSIDAVDLIVQMKQLTGRRLQPDAFKTVRTVQDVVDALAAIIDSDAE